jgi:biotin transport system ATP-binding protein
MTTELRAENVSLKLEGRLILSDLNFSANERRLGIVGRNGSGKTTLARLIAGLIAPSRGRITLAGTDIAKDRKAALRTVGILFQNPDHQIIFPTVEEEIGFGLTQLGLNKSESAHAIDRVLHRFGKEHWAKAGIHRLSQGQKQLVCLMSILAMRPKVIVLDEPFSGLDIPTKLQLSRHLDALDAQLVHISHDPATLQTYDRVLWIDEGAIRADGPPVATLKAFETEMIAMGGTDDLTHLAD